MPVSDVTIAQERKRLMALMDEEPYKIPSRRVDENLLIATWNIQQFSNRHSDRALQYISDICERFDIIALQEVKTDLRGLERLQNMLPGAYRILVSDPTGNSERFAFLYDKRTVIPTGLVCEIGFNVSAKTHSGYQLHRMPYCASFRAGRFDFAIASAHIYFGQTKAQRTQRAKEIGELAKFVAKRARMEGNKVFDRDFFVVGDFNIEEEGDEFFQALAAEKFVMTDKLKSLKTNYNRTRTFDKIVWRNRKSFSPTGQMNVVPFGEVLFKEKGRNGAKKEISDHLPLWVELEVDFSAEYLEHLLTL